MTLPRQWAHALSAAVVVLAAASTSLAAEGSVVSGQLSEGGAEVIGPPTAEQVAAAEEALKAEAAAKSKAAAAAAAAAKKPAAPPAWLAARPAPKAATGKSAMPGTGRMVGLVIVLATLGVAVLYFKRRGKPAVKLLSKPQRLSVVSSTRIGPKAHAVVISVNGRQMLLGVTDSSVKRLAFIDEVEEERDEVEEREPARRPSAESAARLASLAVRAAAPQEPAQSRSFADLLKTAFRKREPAIETDAAVVLAAETHDTVGGRPVVSNVHMLDVEGQAQGLIRRLSGPRA